MSLETPKSHFDLSLREVLDSAEEFHQFVKKCRTELAPVIDEEPTVIDAGLGLYLIAPNLIKKHP